MIGSARMINPIADGIVSKHDQPHGVRERAAKFLRIADRRAPRNERQRDGRDRDAENAERKLHEAKGDVEPGDWTVA